MSGSPTLRLSGSAALGHSGWFLRGGGGGGGGRGKGKEGVLAPLTSQESSDISLISLFLRAPPPLFSTKKQQ